jgi:hypothetical protein
MTSTRKFLYVREIRVYCYARVPREFLSKEITVPKENDSLQEFDQRAFGEHYTSRVPIEHTCNTRGN